MDTMETTNKHIILLIIDGIKYEINSDSEA